MSNYVKATDFSAKDSLLTGDPLKIVSGTEIDDEFNAIQTAVNTKSNTNSPTFTGVPSAPTATAGTNTTQLATTAFVTTALTNYQTVVNAALEAIYPVGSVYTNASVSTNPATLLGFGTWEAFGSGKVLVGYDATDTSFDTLGETGGSKDAINVSHTHTGTASTASISGYFDIKNRGGGVNSTIIRAVSGIFTSGSGGSTGEGWYGEAGATSTRVTMDASHNHTVTVDSAGSSGTNANLQPYITVHMWKRTA